jgi:hypothetical protein
MFSTRPVSRCYKQDMSIVSYSRITVTEAEESGTQRKGNVRSRKPIPKNGYGRL